MRILGPTRVEISGRILTSFAGTNYLGLSFHPRVLEALAGASREAGFGIGASRKTTGTTDQVLELEQRIASLVGAEAAIVTSSGTIANAGLLQGLNGSIDHWLIDANSHPSFTSFLPLSGATIHRYKHLDVEDLARQLAGLKGNVGVFTDTVFALTGEIAPLDEIERVTGKALLVFDEAHSLGVFGKQGRGLVAEFGLNSLRTIVTATFSKALGCTGGLILGPSHWLKWIEKHSTILASTSALSPSLSLAVTMALDVLKEETDRLDRLRNNIDRMRDLLDLPGQSPAAPIFCCFESAAVLSAEAEEAGYLVPLLKSYPGAPEEGMLRWMVSSEHTEEEIRTVSAILRRL
jgi:7-keto-8-aminopelargonate synthetase-like enzyme